MLWESEFEEKYVYPLIKNKSVIYLSYIDDIFMVWIKSECELRQFMNEINEKHQTPKKKNTEFMDTLVYISSNNRFQTTLCKKPTDCQNYLHAKSAHPFLLKKVSYIFRHRELSAYVQSSRNTGNIPNT